VRRPGFVLAIALLLAAPGCGGFYYQAVSGHMRLMADRRPIDEILEDPDTPADLAVRLRLVAEARTFATDVLALPDNDSYRSYVALDRPYVVWNVFAAPELSLTPKTWCFPVAGCVVYRGYFKESAARKYAQRLADKGWDVFVGGAAAYSTLGRFADPVNSAMMRWDDTRLVAIIFHELAHQQLYVADDSDFNEAFASAVEEVGIRLWLEDRRDPQSIADHQTRRQRAAAFNYLLLDTREELTRVYSSDRSDEVQREQKQEAFNDLRERYGVLRHSWDGYPGFDGWFEMELNNARLIPVSTYERLVPAFRALFRNSGRDLRTFYARCQELADLSSEERHRELEALLAIADPVPGTGPSPEL
jgi:predicted aminopeptidase